MRFPEYNITDQSADEHLKMYQYLTQKLAINNKREMLALAKFKINDYECVAISEKAYQYYKDYIDVSEDLDVVNILNSDRNVILVPEEYRETIEDFEEILKAHGIEVTVRREMGTDINAACGQLRRSYLETQK